MKILSVVLINLTFAAFLLCACTPINQTVEVTRIVTQTVQIDKTATYIPSFPATSTASPTPRPRWTISSSETPWRILTVTPGIQVISNDVRPDVEKFVSKQYIKDYLALNVGLHPSGGKVFCGYQPMGIGNSGQTINLYLWIQCSEYYMGDQGVKTGTQINIPVVLIIEVRHGQYKIIDYKDAGGGFEFVKINFPPELQPIILSYSHAPETFMKGLKAAELEVEQEARIYFGN